jgi:hypothetical protein
LFDPDVEDLGEIRRATRSRSATCGLVRVYTTATPFLREVTNPEWRSTAR